MFSVGEDIVAPTIFTDDEVIDYLIMKAFNEIDRIDPLKAEFEFDPIANTSKYGIPDGTLGVSEVSYYFLSDPMKNESPVNFYFEKYSNKVNILTFSDYANYAIKFKYYLEKQHTRPTDNTDSSLNNDQDEAVINFAISYAVKRIYTKSINSSGGSSELTVGRHTTKSSTNQLSQLITLAQSFYDAGMKNLSADVAMTQFSDGNRDFRKNYGLITQLGEFGYKEPLVFKTFGGPA